MAFVVTAAPSEWERVRALVELVGTPRWVEFRGTLFELIALVAGARWVLSPDTAVVHIAAALGKPVVGLYNELIKAAEWYPFGVPSVLAVSPALEGICFMPPGAVVEAVERLFGQVIPSGFVLPRTLLPTAEVSAAGASGRG
jgi:ADP-heptose:LPS heptosyltransferase